MITFDSFFSGSMSTVDAVIADFVHNAYVHYIQANTNVITLLFTFYVMLIGYQFISHHHHFQIGEVVKRMMLMLCVFGLVMNWQLYHMFVYNIFTNEPASISQILIGAAGDGSTSGNISAALDGIYEAVVNASIGFFGEVSFSATGLTFIFYGVLVYFIGTLMCVFALLLFIYAKMMMAVSLALGPVFILFLMWEPTKGLFSAWLNQLITIALIPVITSAILVLMLSVINVTLPHLKQPTEEMQFVGLAPFLGLCLTTTLILSQVLRISSSLGGGIALDSMSSGAAMVSSAWNKIGAPKMVGSAGNIGRKRTTAIYRDRGAS
jgi:type IV secretion system protein VirB6